jgi:hypothetical protein
MLMKKSLKNITSTALQVSCHLGPNRRHFSNKLTICQQSCIHGGGGDDDLVGL